MAVNSFEVGAIFAIKDQSTAVLREMAVSMERLEGLTKSATAALTEFGKGVRIGGLVSRMNTLGESMTTVAAKSAELKTSFASDFETINAGLFSTVQMARELAAAMTEIGVAGTTMGRGMRAGAAGAAGGTGGGGGHRGGGQGVVGGMAKGAGLGHLLSHPATFVGGYAAFEAMEISADLQDTVDRALIAMRIPVGKNYMDMAISQQLQAQIRKTSGDWGMPLPQTEESTLQAVRGLAPLSAEDRMRLLPSVLDFAGAEVFNKHGTTPEEATEAGIGLAHQLRLYTPEKIEPIFGALTQLSMASPQSLSQISRMSSYFLPLLTAGLDMDPKKLMAMGVVGGQMGLNTKSGTWLARMFEAPFTHDLTTKRQTDRRNALEELGLVVVHRDALGHVVSSDAVTKDPFEFVKILSEHLHKIPDKRRLSDLSAAFGEQGSKAATIWTDPAVLKNLEGLFENLKNAPSIASLREQSLNSPRQQLKVEVQDFNIELGKLGGEILPVAITALRGFDALISSTFNHNFFSNLAREWGMDDKGEGEFHKHLDGIWGGMKEIFSHPEKYPSTMPGIWHQMWEKGPADTDPDYYKKLGAKMRGETASASAPQVNISGDIIIQSATADPKEHAKAFISQLNKEIEKGMPNNIGIGRGTASPDYLNGRGYASPY